MSAAQALFIDHPANLGSVAAGLQPAVAGPVLASHAAPRPGRGGGATIAHNGAGGGGGSLVAHPRQ